MAKPVKNKIDELSALVDHHYCMYMVADNRASRREHKEKLNVSIKEYLCVVPHSRKYIFPETNEIIRRSAIIKPDFNPVKASLAWDAIGRYAINLVGQPWRKEFQELKLYAGFYKHEVDENLADADLMFELMGFCHVGDSTMAITDVLDPDRITYVSRDSLTASVECQILREVWDNVTPYYDFAWEEVLDYRENNAGSADQAVKTLKFHRRQLLYDQQLDRKVQEEAPEMHVPLDFVYGSNMGYYDRMYYNYDYPSPSHSHQEPANLQEVLPPSNCVRAEAIKTNDGEQARNVQDVKLVGSRPYSQVVQEEFPELYVEHPNNRSFDSDQSSIPVGQLIELDSTQFQVHAPPKEFLDSDDSASSSEKNGKAEKDEEADKDETSAKAEKSGKNTNATKGKKSGLCENWEYVCKNVRGKKNDSQSNGQGEISSTSSNMEEKKPKEAGQGREREASPVIKRDVNAPGQSRTTCKKGNDSEIEIYIEQSTKPKPRSRFMDDDDYDDDDDDSSMGRKWECITCTFMNTKERKICEMCCKSKEPGNEFGSRPKPGVVCKKCTLINDKDKNFCDACGKRLTYAAIYI